jgi:hypothetical protein
MCGARFTESEPTDTGASIEPNHVGKYTHIVSTHQCEKGLFGCAKLVGVKVVERDAEPEAK